MRIATGASALAMTVDVTKCEDIVGWGHDPTGQYRYGKCYNWCPAES